MPDENAALAEMLRLFGAATSYARGLRSVQSRIDEATVAVRIRMDGMANCLKSIALLLHDQMGVLDLPVLQLEAIDEVKPVAASVHNLKWKKASRASVEIYVNGDLSKPVSLTRQEWEFLKFLATNRPNPRDGMAATRSLEELVGYLSDGKSKTRDPQKYINHMVSRIRIALGKQGFSPDLVKRDEQLGVRFAFRGNL
jgi:hypothetical protein